MGVSTSLTKNRIAVSFCAMSEQNSLSRAIRSARRRAGLSQVELAELLGVRQSSVSQWERGSTKPSTVHLLALAAKLGCSLAELAGAVETTTAGAHVGHAERGASR
jgi:transcriptional regulator with XRE-family HTH domain